MAVKLALDDKQKMLRLYRESDATTTQLAKQFGISTSTVARLLQELIPSEEYRQLVSQKQARGKRKSRESQAVGISQANQLALIADDLPLSQDDTKDQPHGSRPFVQADQFNQFDQGDDTAIAMDDQQRLDSTSEMVDDNLLDEDLEEDEDLLEDDDDLEDDLVDEDNLDLDEALDEDEDADSYEEDEDSELDLLADLASGHHAGDRLEILPLDRADLPIICYIVVDRIADIITRPLKDFKDLGAIPPEEYLSKTIPVFDNHRVARRFSHHNQRVIKFPSDLIQITRPKLVQKGITRILFGGQVFALN